MFRNKVTPPLGGRIGEKVHPKVVYLDVQPVGSAYSVPGLQKDVVYTNIKPVLLLLRALGALPYSHPSPGVTVASFTAPAALYSVVLFTALLTYVGYVSLHRVRIVRSAEGRFEEAVIAYLFTVYLFPVIFLPILWYETRKAAQVLNGWTDFEVKKCHSRSFKIFQPILLKP